VLSGTQIALPSSPVAVSFDVDPVRAAVVAHDRLRRPGWRDVCRVLISLGFIGVLGWAARPWLRWKYKGRWP
jgi:hypothetical protein